MNRRTQNIAIAIVLFGVAVFALVVGTQLGKSNSDADLASSLGEQIVDADQPTTSLEAATLFDPASPSLTTATTLATTTIASTTTLKPTTTSTTSTTVIDSTTTSTTLDETSTTSSTSTTTSTTSKETSDANAESTDGSATPSSTTTSSTTASTETTQATVTLEQETTTTTATTLQTTTTAAPPAGLNQFEQEIARLTSELRANPNGSLKRQKPVPSCEGIRVDRQTGVYEPLSRLQLSEVASLQVARPWSVQMTRNLVHQASAGSGELAAAGITIRTAGENIGWHNYPDVAMQHFIGWRESDGHFCNMMNPAFTHIGVGQHTKPNGDSMATQTFFTPR